MTIRIQIKRAYEEAQPSDGYRAFVDRLWPRGLSKETFKFDAWYKDLAPSAELRTWFGHKVENWEQFKDSYRSELRAPEQQERMRELLAAAGKQAITLLYAAKDTEHNQAVVLAAELQAMSTAARKRAPRKSA
ncbi:hypothetical protein CEY11_00765 [Candidimonas nitroreducens]|uniref:MarR family transcriptional regulator n=2 Tax=Candidimonas nitroreducens TaxID=683354 RepID=A0A225MYI9_9BURK|nr:DUF488 family protein [Candidimonas nitroreducens]OWT66447.1 hypothetical protein CEY11_00765 [Candidimonas nitroreducens]